MFKVMEKMTYKKLFTFFILSVFFVIFAHAHTVNPTQSLKVAFNFKEGMSYTTMRQTLLDAHWLPLRNPDCWTSLDKLAQVCNAFAEVQSCSRDNQCTVSFANMTEKRYIKIYVNGPWGNSQDYSALSVSSWEFLPIQPVSGETCPSGDFTQFLQAFASDHKVKSAFTSPFVKVNELVEDESGDYGSQDVYISADQYQDFNLRYQDKGYHFIDYQGRVDPDALQINMNPIAVNQILVQFQYGVSEGNSYLFENINGCWFLVEDPQPPAP